MNMSWRYISLLSVLVAGALASGGGDTEAQGVDGFSTDAGVEAPALDPGAPEAFGGELQWTVIHASQFTHWYGGSNLENAGNGYMKPTIAAGGWWAQVDLPAGSSVEQVCFLVYDGNDNALWAWMEFAAHESSYDDATTPKTEAFGFTNTTGAATPGYTRKCITPEPPVVIRSWADLNDDGTSHYVAYKVSVESQGAADSTLRLFGVQLLWRHTISAAPGVQTFPDVAPGYWAFQEIEALAAAGITTGFPDGEFKPTAVVTRAQVATFLARALGLHHPF
jgi:hypothetical protein